MIKKKDKRHITGRIIRYTPYGVEILWSDGTKLFTDKKIE